jgi:hypothetical protein
MGQTIASIEAKPFNLNEPDEWKRLIRELRGYMQVSLGANCPHCHKFKREGTDFAGRQYAIDALENIMKQQGQGV